RAERIIFEEQGRVAGDYPPSDRARRRNIRDPSNYQRCADELSHGGRGVGFLVSRCLGSLRARAASNQLWPSRVAPHRSFTYGARSSVMRLQDSRHASLVMCVPGSQRFMQDSSGSLPKYWRSFSPESGATASVASFAGTSSASTWAPKPSAPNARATTAPREII